MSEQSDAHRSHAAITMRLKRADGHLRGIVEMIEAGRPCLDIAQQLLGVAVAQRMRQRADQHRGRAEALDREAQLR
ncbi:MAG: metal-sensing transcriptional repressor [Alphaproteobacteria bacterium]|nr:metal-sensing transcriptional repressor [Alphaproteobacteria bacterium]